MSSALTSTQVTQEQTKTRFYRPELDLLRLFAFVTVFLTHGPRLADSPNHVRHLIGAIYNRVAGGGVYGLSLFFFLSSYLITELLLREQRKTGSIHLRWFYIRRILRIWPLYYLAVACAIILPLFIHSMPALSHHQSLYLLLLVGYLAQAANGNPFGVLWSISVEEFFYAVWPLLVKRGQRWLLISCVLIIPASLAVAFTAFDIWYNPFVQFLFFASGAIFAIVTENLAWDVGISRRLLVAALGLACWIDARILLNQISPRVVATPVAFVLGDLGCILMFLAFLNLRLSLPWITKPLLYLGRISYGLYVFHLLCYQLVEFWLLPHGVITGIHTMVTTQVITIALTIGMATLSYKYFEGPFLRLKERYAPIKTRL